MCNDEVGAFWGTHFFFRVGSWEALLSISLK